jgi:hypothetical protein
MKLDLYECGGSSPPRKYTKHYVRVTPEQHRALTRIAGKDNTTFAHVLRTAIDIFVAKVEAEHHGTR